MSKCLSNLILLCILLFSKAVFADEAVLSDLSIKPSSDGTQIILNFNQPVPYKAFTLPNPSRLVIDIQKTKYRFEGKTDFSGTNISDFRHGIQNGVNLRMVFDLKQSEHFNIQTSHDNGFQIILNLPGKTQDQPAAAAPVTPTPIQTPTPTPTPDPLPVPAIKKSKFIVIIDAGHGGKDPGAGGPGGTKEKNVTLAIAKDLQELVNREPNMKAVLTRSGDYYVGLRDRLGIARKAKGDVFIAIHADAFNGTDAEGASVFALSLHGVTSEAARWLAQKENYSELGGIDLNGIQDQDAQVRSVLIDLSQTATITASLQLGRDTLTQLGKLTELHHGSVEQAPFMVLKSPDVPSILVETGFITNPKEESRLKTEKYQEKIAQALMNGVKQYYQQNAPRNLPQVTPTSTD